MSEEYDPFAEEVDFEEVVEEEEQEQVQEQAEESAGKHEETVISGTIEQHSTSAVNEVSCIDSVSVVATSASGGTKRCLDDTGNTLIINDEEGEVVPGQERDSKKHKKSVHMPAPSTEHEKWLWKTAWLYVRKFLKPYLREEKIASADDLERLSKKLAQKVYEKELAKGTIEITAHNAGRIKKYVASFFQKHDKYDGGSSK